MVFHRAVDDPSLSDCQAEGAGGPCRELASDAFTDLTLHPLARHEGSRGRVRPRLEPDTVIRPDGPSSSDLKPDLSGTFGSYDIRQLPFSVASHIASLIAKQLHDNRCFNSYSSQVQKPR